jgi:hypothetical protein
MLVGVAGREEGQEDLLAEPEILVDQSRACLNIVQDRAVMLHHPARRSAGPGRVDDAGQIGALDSCRGGDARRVRVLRVDQLLPLQEADVAGLGQAAHRFDADDMLAIGAADRRGKQRAGELLRRHDHRAGAAVVQDVLVVALRIGRVGRHRDAARGHDGQVAQEPLRAVLRHQHHPLARLEANALQPRGKARDRLGRLLPAGGAPLPLLLDPQEGPLAALAGTREEHGDEVGESLQLAHPVSLHGRARYPASNRFP